MPTARTGSTKIDRILDEARSLGLSVEVEVTDDPMYDGIVSRSVFATIAPADAGVPATNGLELYNRSRRIYLGWYWWVGNGATPKLVSASSSSMGGSHDMKARVVPYAIRQMKEL